MEFKNKRVGYVLCGLLFLSVFTAFNACQNVKSESTATTTDTVVVQKEQKEFGIPVKDYQETKKKVKPNQFLSKILTPYGVKYPVIAKIVQKSKPVFDVRDIKAGRPYTVFCSKDTTQKLCYFVYQPNEVDYVVFDLTDSVRVYKDKLPVTTKEKTISGVINGSLYGALSDVNSGVELAMKLGEVYAWDVDFYRIQAGDWFKIVYEEKYIKGKPVGLGKIKAAILNHVGHDYYAFYFNSDSTDTKGYFDKNAKSLRKEFLKAPLKTFVITSHYSLHRYHPVQHRWKAHLGTDYAAPKGTPIMTTASGVVIASRRSRFNGNYVKIRHNGVYTTQYLHMSKRAVHVGEHVDQGEVIGYVGSTGLATGPHVCYRFWKNGKQVNPYDQDFPPAEPIPQEDLPVYNRLIHHEEAKLSQIQVDRNEMKLSDTDVEKKDSTTKA